MDYMLTEYALCEQQHNAIKTMLVLSATHTPMQAQDYTDIFYHLRKIK